MQKWWYLKIKFKEKYDGRKVYYMNNGYLCDCVNLPFTNKAECGKYISRVKAMYGDRIELITIHWTRRM